MERSQQNECKAAGTRGEIGEKPEESGAASETLLRRREGAWMRQRRAHPSKVRRRLGVGVGVAGSDVTH